MTHLPMTFALAMHLLSPPPVPGIESVTDGRTRIMTYAYADTGGDGPVAIEWARPLSAADLSAFQTNDTNTEYGLIYECRHHRAGRLAACRMSDRQGVEGVLTGHLQRLPDRLRLSPAFAARHDPATTWIYISLQVSSENGRRRGGGACIPPICSIIPPPPPPPPR